MPLSSGSASRSTASCAKVPLDQRRNGLVAVAGPRRMQQLKRHANLGAQAEQPRQRRRNQLGGNQEHQPVGQRHQPVAHDDIGLAGRVVRGDQLAAEAQLAAQFRRRRLFGEKRVRPALEHRAIHNLGGQRAAQPRPLLKERVLDRRARRARFFELIGRRQSRNAAADDRNPHP